MTLGSSPSFSIMSLRIFLQNFKGIGKKRSFFISNFFKIPLDISISKLPKKTVLRISFFLQKFFLLNKNFNLFLKSRLNLLNSINNLRSFRKRNHLPVKGQRTKTNKRTAQFLKVRYAID